MSWIQTVFKPKGERIVAQHTGVPQGDYQPPKPGDYGYVNHGPTPTMPIQLNWSGFQYWQTFRDLEYPQAHRPIVQKGNSDSTALYYLMRNAGVTIAAAPIAIQDYSLNQYQTYNGTEVSPSGS